MNILEHINNTGYYFGEQIGSLSDAKTLIKEIFGKKYTISENIISIDTNSSLPSDSFSDIPWHQEDYYKEVRPNYLCLYCSSSGLPSETTQIIPTDGIVRALTLSHPDIEQYKISFLRVRGAQQSSWFPLIEYMNGHFNLRFAEPDARFRTVYCLPDDGISKAICNIIEVSDKIDFVPAKGNLIIFDNFRFLHSRSELDRNSSRKLHRYLIY